VAGNARGRRVTSADFLFAPESAKGLAHTGNLLAARKRESRHQGMTTGVGSLPLTLKTNRLSRPSKLPVWLDAKAPDLPISGFVALLSKFVVL
jgi:hypothetical protein